MQPTPRTDEVTVPEETPVPEPENSTQPESKQTETDGNRITGSKTGSDNESSKKRHHDFYSAELGCEVSVPLSDFIVNTHRRDFVLRKQSSSLMPLRSSKAAVVHKPLKFDPPTFKLGSNSPDLNYPEDSKAEAGKDEILNNSQDQAKVDIMPSYCLPTEKWDKKEVDLLVECSRRWISDLKRRKVLEDGR